MKLMLVILIMGFIHTRVDVMSMSIAYHAHDVTTIKQYNKNAYATILYMGTPHDYEFYTAARVLFQSLIKFKTNADLIVIASQLVPQKWISVLNNEDVIVKVIKDIPNPYAKGPKFDKRFMFTLNKLYAWTLTDYERIVMLDVDNIFLRPPEELFQCGEFCAAFINPCIFHTGLFVLKPSNDTFNNMLQEIHNEIPNKDGADQGFLTSYFNDLLDRPLFHPPINGIERLTGFYRLPESYQMDAALYYLNLKWHAPCGLRSAITFPSIPLLKPWFWWSYPILPLGILWHEKRLATIGYNAEKLILAAEVVIYIFSFFAILLIKRRFMHKVVHDRKGLEKISSNHSHGIEQSSCHSMVLKSKIMLTLILSYFLPFILIPTTVHPLLGWGVFLFGTFMLLLISINVFQLHILPVMVPWLEGFGMLFVMFWPHHSSGISRSLIMMIYACLSSPCLWWCFKKLFILDNESKNQEPLMSCANPKFDVIPELSKLC